MCPRKSYFYSNFLYKMYNYFLGIQYYLYTEANQLNQMERAKEIKVLTLRESREKSNIRIMRATKKIKKSKEKDGTSTSKKVWGGGGGRNLPL